MFRMAAFFVFGLAVFGPDNLSMRSFACAGVLLLFDIGASLSDTARTAQRTTKEHR